MNSEFVELEEQLRSLPPADVALNRDQLIFAAGARSGGQQSWQRCRVCLASTVVLSLLFVASTAVLMARSDVIKVPMAGKGGANAQETVTEKEGDNGLQPQSSGQASQIGFSGIHKVDSWSRDELRKQGISVRPWKHALQSEEPPLNWVEITFDTSRVAAYQDILMTAWCISDNGTSEVASRDQTAGAKDKSLMLLIATKEHFRENSYVDIIVWKPTANGGCEAQGYKLSMKKIIELARDK